MHVRETSKSERFMLDVTPSDIRQQYKASAHGALLANGSWLRVGCYVTDRSDGYDSGDGFIPNSISPRSWPGKADTSAFFPNRFAPGLLSSHRGWAAAPPPLGAAWRRSEGHIRTGKVRTRRVDAAESLRQSLSWSEVWGFLCSLQISPQVGK